MTLFLPKKAMLVLSPFLYTELSLLGGDKIICLELNHSTSTCPLRMCMYMCVCVCGGQVSSQQCRNLADTHLFPCYIGICLHKSTFHCFKKQTNKQVNKVAARNGLQRNYVRICTWIPFNSPSFSLD